MALLDDIMNKETKLGQDFQTFATQVQGQNAALSAQVASLQAQLAAGNPVTDAQLQAISDGLDKIDQTVLAAGTPPAPATQAAATLAQTQTQPAGPVPDGPAKAS